jgi:Ni/Fe-hydrogenase subunit HybB-like protein
MQKINFRGLLTPWPILAGIILAVSAVIAFFRYVYGIGSVTNLTDAAPWGLWIGFDILTGVGLAAGGFIMTTTVYIFGREKFRPIVRMSILTAFLGYLIFIWGLLIELGRPWVIWHAIIYWNIHSPLFEVAWCVMLYTTVLFLEFTQVIFDKFGLKKLTHIFHKISVPLVIAGALLSTLHQSTLGTLFAIVPGKMYPLWYSPIIPVIFFVSCVAGGLAMVVVESYLSKRFFRHEIPMNLVLPISRALMFALGVYTLVRLADLFTRGALGLMFANAPETPFFWLENILFIVIPLILLNLKSLKNSAIGIGLAGTSAVFGFIVHRINVVTTAFQRVNGGYFPSWQEFMITLCLVTLGFIIIGLVVRFLPIFPEGSLIKTKAEQERYLNAKKEKTKSLKGFIKLGWNS